MVKPEILFLITARGGSKGVPGKNLRKINGLSLIAYKAISARKSKYCSRLVVSSDDPEMQAEAAAHGAEVPFTRPARLATDSASSSDVIMHTLDHVENVEKRTYDAIMLLEPSSPFAKASDYDAAVEMFISKSASLVVGMREVEVNSIFVGPLEPDGRIKRIISKFAGKKAQRRQDFEPEYTMNGALYLIEWDSCKKTGAIYGDPENSYGYLMDRAHSIEIDTLDDLKQAEYLAQSGHLDMKNWQ